MTEKGCTTVAKNNCIVGLKTNDSREKLKKQAAKLKHYKNIFICSKIKKNIYTIRL